VNEIVSSQQHDASVQLASQRRGVTSCPICHAVYAPAQSQSHLLQASPQVIEAALMSMCHFCFRCRRPSCPGCWDEVHGICGSCVQEVGLPFRQNVPPLAGAWSAPVHNTLPAKHEPSASPPLVCVQPGHLEQSSSPIPTFAPRSTDSVQIVSQQFTQPIQRLQPQPMTEREAQTQPPLAQPPTAPAYVTPPTSPAPTTFESAPPNEMPGSSTILAKRKLGWRIGKVVIGVVLLLLALILVLIVAASFNASVNSFVATLLHVDIRAEIAYLWQLIRSLW
jgi:hypothetical protein